MQTQPKTHTANHRPNTGPTGQDLDTVLGDLGRAHTALSGMRSLVHVHSTRHVLTVNEDSVQCLLEKRDEVIAALGAALLGYADAVDPSGTLRGMVATAIDAGPQPELVPVDDERVYGIRHMRRTADGQLVEVTRYS